MRNVYKRMELLILSALVCCGCVSNSVSVPDSSSEAIVEVNAPEEDSSAIWEWTVDDKWAGDITAETKGEFLKHFMGEGAVEEEPLYTYYETESTGKTIEDRVQLELYYNEAEKVICGIRYIYSQGGQLERMEGFASLRVKESDQTWSYSEEAIFSVQKDDSDGSEFVDNYEETRGYNEAGQLVHFESTGDIIGGSEETGRTIIQVDFSYRTDGTLSQKTSSYNPNIWGTTGDFVHEYFDEQERLVYARSYVTHGGLEYYYIYWEESETPTYSLVLDDNAGSYYVVGFTKQK